MASSDRALEAAADRVCITANHEAASRIEHVLERSATYADLQHAAVKATFKVEVVAEGHLGRGAVDGNAWRVKSLVADSIGIINERSIGDRIGRRERISVI
jgi:hypothetical protein